MLGQPLMRRNLTLQASNSQPRTRLHGGGVVHNDLEARKCARDLSRQLCSLDLGEVGDATNAAELDEEMQSSLCDPSG